MLYIQTLDGFGLFTFDDMDKLRRYIDPKATVTPDGYIVTTRGIVNDQGFGKPLAIVVEK